MKARFKGKCFLGMLIMLLGGCTGGDGADLSTLEKDADLASSFLADPYSFSKSQPAQDPEIDAMLAQLETEVSDPFADVGGKSSSLMDATRAFLPVTADDLQGCKTHFVRVRWGNFGGIPNPVEGTEWSGSFEVPFGTLAVQRTVAFDAQDSLHSREEPTKIGFTSRTLPHFDGLRFKWVICDADRQDLGDGVEPQLTLNFPSVKVSETVTGLTYTYNESALTFVDDLYQDVDVNRNRVRVRGTLKSDLCLGEIIGEYRGTGLGYGYLKGIVVADNGIYVGRGIGMYFVDEPGSGDFAMNIFGRRGRYKGSVEGTGMENEDGLSGTMDGTVYRRRNIAVGTANGSYFKGDVERHGTISLSYNLDCSVVEEAISEGEDA